MITLFACIPLIAGEIPIWGLLFFASCDLVTATVAYNIGKKRAG